MSRVRNIHSRNIPFSVKRLIFSKPCVICSTTYDIHVDHIIPFSKGGTSADSNLQPLCFQCNYKKKDRLTNDQLREWFGRNREEHLLKAGYAEFCRYLNRYDGPGFDQWKTEHGQTFLNKYPISSSSTNN